MRLSIVVPCFNEQDVIPQLFARLVTAAQQVTENDYQLIVVNDGSSDRSWELIRQHADQNPCIIGVDLSRNFGHQAALTAGLALAEGERIFILDADLQDPPELLCDMMRAMDEGADVVYGQRINRSEESFFKKISSHFFYRLLAFLSDTPIPLDTGDFRLISQRVKEAFFSMPEKQRFIRGMIAWIGFKQVAIHYERQARFAGQSKYPWPKMVGLAANAITSFSISPLRASVLLALFFAVIGCSALVYVAFSWLVLNHAQGWTSIAAIICILGSAQLLVLGIMGEYIGRIYLESKARPLYLIDQVYRSKRVS